MTLLKDLLETIQVKAFALTLDVVEPHICAVRDQLQFRIRIRAMVPQLAIHAAAGLMAGTQKMLKTSSEVFNSASQVFKT